MTEKHKASFERRLRAEYVEGRIEVDEFERRIAAILKGRPDPADLRLVQRDLRFGAGVAANQLKLAREQHAINMARSRYSPPPSRRLTPLYAEALKAIQDERIAQRANGREGE
jgi:hypothetical protein